MKHGKESPRNKKASHIKACCYNNSSSHQGLQKKKLFSFLGSQGRKEKVRCNNSEASCPRSPSHRLM